MSDLYVKPSKEMFATEYRDLEEMVETFTLGKVLGRFKGEGRGRAYGFCADEFYGLHFDLPPNDVLENGQILVVLYNVKLVTLKQWTSGKVDLSVWPHVSVWGNERGKYVGNSVAAFPPSPHPPVPSGPLFLLYWPGSTTCHKLPHL